MVNREKLESVITAYLFRYYQMYVEPLEKDHDALIDENIELRNQIKKLNKQLDSNGSLYRDMAIRFKKERDMYKRKATK